MFLTRAFEVYPVMTIGGAVQANPPAHLLASFEQRMMFMSTRDPSGLRPSYSGQYSSCLPAALEGQSLTSAGSVPQSHQLLSEVLSFENTDECEGYHFDPLNYVFARLQKSLPVP